MYISMTKHFLSAELLISQHPWGQIHAFQLHVIKPIQQAHRSQRHLVLHSFGVP